MFRLRTILLLLLLPGIGYAESAPLRLCVDPDWHPFEIINSRGEHEGIAADLLQLVIHRAGLSIRLQQTRDWNETLRLARRRECDLVSFLNESPERSAYLLFSDPLFTDTNILIARQEYPFITDPGSLGSARLALPSGTSIEERVRQQYPALQFLITASEAEALQAVNDRQADFTIRSLTVAAHTIRREGWFNLKIAGQLPGYDNLLRIGISPARAELIAPLNAAIATLTAAEINAIVNRHVGLRVEGPVSYRLLWQMLLGFVVIILLIALTSLYWIRRLQGLNQRLQQQSLTDTLTRLPNRLALDRQFAALLDKARRYRRPLALVMLDLDHFKRINDELGHQCGDQVLQEAALLIESCIRGSDMAGRWGGEEFLILCPETSAEQAAQLANRIRDGFLAHSFASQRLQTISAGVAGWVPGDSADSLLQRADQALYEAKARGRNCSVTAAEIQTGSSASR